VPEEQEELEVAARPFWNGTVSFGLVNVPVGLFPASRPNNVALRMVSPKGTPLQRRYYTSRDQKMLTWDDIVRGYEIEKGKFVLLDDDELERIAPEKTGGIDLREFVKATDVDPVYFEHGYYLVPTGTNTKAYRLLARVMEDEGLAGIATFVMRAKEYLVAIFAENGILRLETMRFADELRSPETIRLPKPPARISSTDVNRMQRAIAKLSEEKFDEKELVDHTAVKLWDVVVKKLEKGEDVVEAPETDEEEGPSGDVIDLMAALEKSLKRGRSPKPARSSRRKARA
jgi:DNA end-binding protein Ku